VWVVVVAYLLILLQTFAFCMYCIALKGQVKHCSVSLSKQLLCLFREIRSSIRDGFIMAKPSLVVFNFYLGEGPALAQKLAV